eukprot:3559085-Prymnesium_polylepis.2
MQDVGRIRLRGVVANQGWPRAVLARGTLDALSLETVPVGVGWEDALGDADGSNQRLLDSFQASVAETGHAYLNRQPDTAADGLLLSLYEDAGPASIALLVMSQLTDVADFIRTQARARAHVATGLTRWRWREVEARACGVPRSARVTAPPPLRTPTHHPPARPHHPPARPHRPPAPHPCCLARARASAPTSPQSELFIAKTASVTVLGGVEEASLTDGHDELMPEGPTHAPDTEASSFVFKQCQAYGIRLVVVTRCVPPRAASRTAWTVYASDLDADLKREREA